MSQVANVMMHAIIVDGYGWPVQTRFAEITTPDVREGTLLVRLHASGINPFDQKIVSGMVKDFFPVTFPYVPGMDGAGEVAAVGSGVSGWNEGDAVLGMFSTGTFAEYALIPAADPRLTKKPAGLDWTRAAVIPEAALTATTMIRAADVRPGQSVFVVGATGGIGMFLTQLAKRAGAEVVVTGKRDDEAYLRGLGADDVIDYSASDALVAAHDRYPKGFDAVFDVVHFGKDLVSNTHVMRSTSTLVSSLGGPDQSEFPAGISVKYIEMQAAPGDLGELARLAAEGSLKVDVGATYELAQAAQALEDLVGPKKHILGKIALLTG